MKMKSGADPFLMTDDGTGDRENAYGLATDLSLPEIEKILIDYGAQLCPGQKRCEWNTTGLKFRLAATWLVRSAYVDEICV